MVKSIYFGKMRVQPGDYLSVLISGRVFVVEVEEVTEYGQVIGKDVNDNPVMLRLGKAMAVRKLTKEEFDLRKGDNSGAK